MLSWLLCQILTAPCIRCSRNKTHQTRKPFFNLLLYLLSSFGKIIASVSCSQLTGVVFCCCSTERCSSALTALIVTSGYLSYCWLCYPENCSSLDIFSVFRPFSVNRWCVGKSQQTTSFWNTQARPSGTNNHPSKLPKSSFLSFWFSECVSRQLNHCT